MTETIHLYTRGITATAEGRTLAGEVVQFGRVGFTNIGPLRTAARGQVIRTPNGPVTAPGLSWPSDVTRVKMTREHDRSTVRGYLTALDETSTTLRAVVKANADEDGDAALREAMDKKRDGFSLDVPNGVIVDDVDGGPPWLIGGDLIALGQVGLPAYFEGSRIDRVAASAAEQGKETRMTEEQKARLRELLAKQSLSADEQSELSTLSALAAQEVASGDDAPADTPADTPAPAQAAVAASVPTVPAGIPRPNRAPTTTEEGALDRFIRGICEGYGPDGRGAAHITAALNDVTHAQHSGNIATPAWSGELWSGVQYEPEFSGLFNQGDLTSYEGKGWRWVTKPAMADYTGNKAAVPTDTPDTEAATYTAARMAVGHDIDRKFYDFPDEGFLRGYVEAVRESWAVKLDAKVEAFIAANAVDSGLDMIDETDDAAVLKGVAKLGRAVKRARIGRPSFVIMHDDLFDTLLDVTNLDVPAFLNAFLPGLNPEDFTSSSLAAYEGKIVAGAKQAATVRTLPGSPIRAEAQRIANGGIDNGFFGYWAVELHATNGIQYVEVGDVTP